MKIAQWIVRISLFIGLALTFAVMSIIERWPFLLAGLAVGAVLCFSTGRFS